MTSEPVVQSWPSMMSWVDPHPFNWVNSIKTQRNAIYGRPQKPTLLRSSPQHRPTMLAAATARQPAVRRAPFSHQRAVCALLPAVRCACNDYLLPILHGFARDAVYVRFFSMQILSPRSGTFRKFLMKPQVTHSILPAHDFHRHELTYIAAEVFLTYCSCQ